VIGEGAWGLVQDISYRGVSSTVYHQTERCQGELMAAAAASVEQPPRRRRKGGDWGLAVFADTTPAVWHPSSARRGIVASHRGRNAVAVPLLHHQSQTRAVLEIRRARGEGAGDHDRIGSGRGA